MSLRLRALFPVAHNRPCGREQPEGANLKRAGTPGPECSFPLTSIRDRHLTRRRIVDFLQQLAACVCWRVSDACERKHPSRNFLWRPSFNRAVRRRQRRRSKRVATVPVSRIDGKHASLNNSALHPGRSVPSDPPEMMANPRSLWSKR